MEPHLDFPRGLRGYISQETIDSASVNIRRLQNMLEVRLSPYETTILKIQSLLLWTETWLSALATALIVIISWALCSNNVIGAICFLLLTLYWIYLWKSLIWPTIRVPLPRNEEEEWVPVHINFFSLADIAHYSARAIVMIRACGEALYNLRLRRRSAFVALMYAYSSCLLVIGHYCSGRSLFLIFLFCVLVVPATVYHNILPKAYAKVQPHLGALHNKLAPIFEALNLHLTPLDYGRRVFQHNSEDADVHALIDSDELHLGLTGGNARNLRDTLQPDVLQMPDYEGVCEESQRMFMLDLDAMPSMDIVDRSRLLGEVARLKEQDENTDSDADSLALDPEPLRPQSRTQSPLRQGYQNDNPASGIAPSAPRDSLAHMAPSPAAPSAPMDPTAHMDPSAHMAPSASMTQAAPAPSAPDWSAQPTGQAQFTFDGLSGAVSQFAAGMFKSVQPDQDLKRDPRDRIADASIDEELDGSLAFQESSDEEYEIISRDELR